MRDQAYNAFSAFSSSQSDPRFLIDGQKKLSLNRDLYFAIYQSLWNEDKNGKRLFEQFPEDFFDLIIIDECHRSGFGTWKEILDRFNSAIHLGMTATPKQEESVDTYQYFCQEEAVALADFGKMLVKAKFILPHTLIALDKGLMMVSWQPIKFIVSIPMLTRIAEIFKKRLNVVQISLFLKGLTYAPIISPKILSVESGAEPYSNFG